MCRDGQATPCDDPSHHADHLTFDGPAIPRAWRSIRRQRRPVLAGAAAFTTAACASSTGAASVTGVSGPPVEEAPTITPDPTVTTVPPALTPAPVVVPEPQLVALGPTGIVQPFWSGDGSRVLFYDQPPGGQGGTWSVDAGSRAVAHERPHWGYYVAGGTLLAAPRPAQRDTHIVHLPSGREWTLPTTNSTVFSGDGTLVAYPVAATGQPGGAPPGPGQGFSGPAPAFALTTIVVSWADGQHAQRMQLPINGTVFAWLPAPDGTPNARLLLAGRRSADDDPALWVFDLRDRTLIELGRSRRLVGVLPSSDGTWVAHVAMWNPDASVNGLWVTRTDGALRRRIDLVGSYRWTAGNHLYVMPHRSSPADSHEVWHLDPATGTARRLADPSRLSFRVANHDWDVSPDGTNLVFVSAADRQLWCLHLPRGALARDDAPLPVIPEPPRAGTGGKPYRLPFATAPGPSTWYVAQWYGVTTGGYRGRNTTYAQGQGIHFGIDFAAPCGTPVVAIAPGRVLAVDGNFGSPPHNVVLQLFDGNIAMYGHLVERSRHVQVGQTVEPGQVIGNTGDSIPPYNCTRNPHLHLEIRKGGRAVATNPVPYFDANWDDMTLGVYPGPRFERDLDNPKRHQFLDDQPDIWFGGPVITNFARAWPP